MKGEAPQYLIGLFKTKIYETSLVLRNSENKLNLQKPRTNCFKGSFSYSGAVVWNSLPAETRSSVVTPFEEYAQSRTLLSVMHIQHANVLNIIYL